MASSEGLDEQRQIGELRSDVRHLQSDVTDLRAEIRVVSQKVDTLRVELGGRIDKLKEETRQDLKETREDVKGLREEFCSFKVDVTREFGSVRTEMRTEFQAVRTAIEASKRWTIVAGAGMIGTALGALAALGRVMKWF